MQNITAVQIDGNFTKDEISNGEILQIKQTSKWLIALAITVIVMMLIGALTRLTGSGLSIPEWPLINGSLMYPLSDADWNSVFETYKKFSQYQILNSQMSLNEFKVIFFFEYFHRSITSAISVLLLISCYKIYRIKCFRSKYIKNIILLILLLFVQALAGYYMVKSGLEPGKANVSQYRLMIHLSLAFLFLSSVLWTLWSLVQSIEKTTLNRIKKHIFVLTNLLLFLISLQIMSGALVAGTKAGFHFNEWPLMAGQLIPDHLISSNGVFNNTLLNFTENILTIQFVHRNIAYLITILTIVYILLTKKCRLNHRTELAINVLAITLASQVVLGIITLLMHVPILLGVLHQLGAILLFCNMLYIFFRMREYEITDY